jgi:hypothetical protein
MNPHQASRMAMDDLAVAVWRLEAAGNLAERLGRADDARIIRDTIWAMRELIDSWAGRAGALDTRCVVVPAISPTGQRHHVSESTSEVPATRRHGRTEGVLSARDQRRRTTPPNPPEGDRR